MDILLGIDIGTTKMCAVAFDANRGTVLAVHSAANDTAIPAEMGACEQDACKILSRAIELMGETVDSLGSLGARIVAVGVTGQMHGVVLTDAQSRPITPLITWQDQRGNLRCSSSDLTYAEEVRRRIGEENLARTGTAPATGYGGVTLLRLADHTDIPADAKALTISDYLVYRLTGAAVTDPTDAASWGIYDVQAESGWMPGIAEQLENFSERSSGNQAHRICRRWTAPGGRLGHEAVPRAAGCRGAWR